jgi:hypothetical protein
MVACATRCARATSRGGTNTRNSADGGRGTAAALLTHRWRVPRARHASSRPEVPRAWPVPAPLRWARRGAVAVRVQWAPTKCWGGGCGLSASGVILESEEMSRVAGAHRWLLRTAAQILSVAIREWRDYGPAFTRTIFHNASAGAGASVDAIGSAHRAEPCSRRVRRSCGFFINTIAKF